MQTFIFLWNFIIKRKLLSDLAAQDVTSFFIFCNGFWSLVYPKTLGNYLNDIHQNVHHGHK